MKMIKGSLLKLLGPEGVKPAVRKKGYKTNHADNAELLSLEVDVPDFFVDDGEISEQDVEPDVEGDEEIVENSDFFDDGMMEEDCFEVDSTSENL